MIRPEPAWKDLLTVVAVPAMLLGPPLLLKLGSETMGGMGRCDRSRCKWCTGLQYYESCEFLVSPFPLHNYEWKLLFTPDV